MRKYAIALFAAATVLGLATPAGAQYYPAPQRGYYGGGYGGGSEAYNSLRARIDQLQRRIREFDARGLLTDGQARQRYHESRIIEGQLHGMARDGFSRREASELERGLAVFERQVWNDTNGGRGWGREGSRRGGDWSDRGRYERDRWDDD